MSLDEAMGRAFAAADGLVAAARQKAAAMGGSMATGQGASNSPGMKLERMRHLSGWTYSLARFLAQKVAAQPVRMARRPAQGQRPLPGRRADKKAAPRWLKQTVTEELELIERHELLDVFCRPNEDQVGWSFMYVSVMSLLSAGECYWWLPRDAPGLVMFYLSPSWVTPQHTERRLFDEYLVNFQNTGVQITVPKEDMVRMSLPNPINPLLTTLSPLQAQAETVVTDQQILTAQQRAFENGLFPGLGIVIGRSPDVAGVPGQRPMLSKEQRMSLTLALKQAYKGVMNAGEPVIMDGLIEDVKTLTNAPAEMGFMESSGLVKERLTQSFLVNPIVMGQIEGANRASSAVAQEHVCDNAINPLIELMSQHMTFDLAPRIGEPDVLLWIEPCVAHDDDADRARIDLKAKTGCYTRNEIRAAMGDPPLDDERGDELVGPAAPAPLVPNEGGAAGDPARSFRLYGGQAAG